MSLRTLNPYYRWVFPWLLDRVSAVVAPELQKLLLRAKGQVLEIGAGTGTRFHCYGEQVAKLFALEPDIGVMEKARSSVRSLFVFRLQETALLVRCSKILTLVGAAPRRDIPYKSFGARRASHNELRFVRIFL